MSTTTILARGPSLRSLRHFFVRNVPLKPVECTPHDISVTLAALKTAFDRHADTITAQAAVALANFVAQVSQDDVAGSLTPPQCKAIDWIDERLRKLTDPHDWLATIQLMIALHAAAPVDPELAESFIYWL